MSLSQYRLGTALSDFIGQRRELLIDGVPVDCVSGASFEVLDPSTGAPVAVVAEAGAADGSVFSTSTGVNPTATVAAFALRCAERLVQTRGDAG